MTTAQRTRGSLLELRTAESRSGSVRGEYLLAPIPPAGPIDVATAWPQLGMDEKVVTLDGEGIASASASASESVTQLWEPKRQPDPDLTSEQVTHQLQYQRGGWFGIRLD
ncbi:hypothetical protein [Rhodococcus erythropolis]|uniref:hypothetical protein n=1 Tax=Rhodococcus erythropolis TaxID=1833 RepID=UPI003F667D4A